MYVGNQDDLSLTWFCVRSQPKHEHVAAANLRRNLGIEVFSPKMRFKRITRRGTILVTQSLFPSYLFARFDFNSHLRDVQHTGGVVNIVHFGTFWPRLDDFVITQLRELVGPDEIRFMGFEFQPGDEVQICGGALHGLQAVVTTVLPARKRVAVLLDFLGRQTRVELPADSIVKSAA